MFNTIYLHSQSTNKKYLEFINKKEDLYVYKSEKST